MYHFNEELLQFIWRHRLLKPGTYFTTTGLPLKILQQGELNHDAGPDFFNSRIEVNGVTLAGNIEIHIRSSDWLKHGHQGNKNYDNIILHVVYEHDLELAQNLQNNVEVFELKQVVSNHTLNSYAKLAEAGDKLSCSGQLDKLDDLKFISWLERMTVERLEHKVKYLESLWHTFHHDYTQTFYTALLRNFGFKVNAVPFELLAVHLPANILLKHSDNLLQMEALLLGMSGTLEQQFADKYMRLLQNEFNHLCYKYKLKPLNADLFRYSKLRPANFPNVRLVQFAALVHKYPSLITAPHLTENYEELKKRFLFEVSEYWQYRYKADSSPGKKPVSFGNDAFENVIINTFAPFLFFYSKRTDKPHLSERCISLLHTCVAEDNLKTRLFSGKKELLKSAAESQALINLYDHYCSQRKCLKCGVAAALLR